MATIMTLGSRVISLYRSLSVNGLHLGDMIFGKKCSQSPKFAIFLIRANKKISKYTYCVVKVKGPIELCEKILPVPFLREKLKKNKKYSEISKYLYCPRTLEFQDGYYNDPWVKGHQPI